MRKISHFGFFSALLMTGAFAGYSFHNHNQLQADSRNVASYPKELTSYRDIVKRCLPAVVSIEPLRKVRTSNGVTNQVTGVGSGVIVDSRGVILTNYHVVDGADSLAVLLSDGKRFVTTDIRGDRKTDLAVVKIHPDQPLPSLSFANSDEMEVGDRVLAIGAPYGLAGSVTHGIINKSRNLKMNLYEDFIQTDAAVNPGNSGGPLINMEGKIIGINSAIKSKSGGFQGISMSISSNIAKQIMETLLRDGIVKRGYLGIGILDIDEQLAKQLGRKSNSGVVISRIYEDTPAAKAGLKVGDIITRIDEKSINTGDEFTKTIALLAAGKTSDLAIIRDGKPVNLRVLIEEQPATFGLKD